MSLLTVSKYQTTWVGLGKWSGSSVFSCRCLFPWYGLVTIFEGRCVLAIAFFPLWTATFFTPSTIAVLGFHSFGVPRGSPFQFSVIDVQMQSFRFVMVILCVPFSWLWLSFSSSWDIGSPLRPKCAFVSGLSRSFSILCYASKPVNEVRPTFAWDNGVSVKMSFAVCYPPRYF